MSEYSYEDMMPMDVQNEETGEIVHGVWIADESENRNLVRYFYKHSKAIFVDLLSSSTDKKMNVLAYLVKEMNASTNKISVTHKKLAQEVGLPESTINNAMNFLQDNDYIRMPVKGVWMINPDLCMKGYESKYLKLYREYKNYPTRLERLKKKGSEENDQHV